MINTKHKNALFLNQINGNIPRSGVIYQETINPRYLFYQCSKDGPNFLFGTLSTRDYRYKPHFLAK